MASLNFYMQGNKHLHFKVLQIKINEKQTLLWVWRLYWKTGQGRNEYFLWFVKELHNECQVMWKAWHFIQPLHSLAKSSQTTHIAKAKWSKWRMISLFLLVYRMIRLLFTTDTSKSQFSHQPSLFLFEFISHRLTYN